jgi:ribosomal protein S12 methylthiotransferase accessory factor
VNAEFNGFTVKTDQPVKEGGEGTAPSPYEYFLASIGTCAGIYVLSFCEKRGIPAEHISLAQRLEYRKTDEGKKVLEKIVLEILVPAAFPEKYHQALVKVADQCAVKKTIMNPPQFEIKTIVKQGDQ